MTFEYRYTLEPYKGVTSRYTCPECNKDRTFSRYIDNETGLYIANHVGRCNRESNCSYHYRPKEYFQDNNINASEPFYYPHKEKKLQHLPFSCIEAEVFKQSLAGYKQNCFVKYLSSLFGHEITKGLVSRYFIGSSKKRFKSKDLPDYISEPGATVFWQIDNKGRVRTGKIMLYSPSTGKRVKAPVNHITWVHSLLKKPQFVLNQCLFGEHLLKVEPENDLPPLNSTKC